MADASVRPAGTADVDEIARIQIQTWRQAYSSVMPARVLDALDAADVAGLWRSAITEPPSEHHHLLVALEQDTIVGFTAITPAEVGDPDDTGAITILLVEPRFGRRGHGSRLLAAAVEHLREDGLARAVTWTLVKDAASQNFFRSAGWDADGAARALKMAESEVDEIRLHAAL